VFYDNDEGFRSLRESPTLSAGPRILVGRCAVVKRRVEGARYSVRSGM